MTKRIEIWEGPTFVTWNLEDYITAHSIGRYGIPLTPDDGRMFDDEIDQLRNMAVFESISVGQPEAGLTVRRIPDSP